MPEVVEVHPDDCGKLGVDTGRMVTVSSRRGTISLKVRKGTYTEPGSVFIPFHFRATDKLDPVGKIPEFKFCAVKVVPA